MKYRISTIGVSFFATAASVAEPVGIANVVTRLGRRSRDASISGARSVARKKAGVFIYAADILTFRELPVILKIQWW